MSKDAFLGITQSASGARWIGAPNQLAGPNQDRLAAALTEFF